MHNTKVVMKDGRTFDAPIHKFRPAENPSYITLFGHDEILYFKDMVSAITEGERIGYGQVGTQDEIQRARKYLKDAREYNWHGTLSIQEWENNQEQIQ